jgi:hypothetical protein
MDGFGFWGSGSCISVCCSIQISGQCELSEKMAVIPSFGSQKVRSFKKQLTHCHQDL